MDQHVPADRIAKRPPSSVYAYPAMTGARADIQFVCSPTDFHAGKPVLIATVPPIQDEGCQFYFEWRSHVACPTNRKSELETGHYIAFGSM